jgi:hypothetical protein
MSEWTFNEENESHPNGKNGKANGNARRTQRGSGQGEQTSEERRKQSTRLVELCADVEFFHTGDFRHYAALEVNEHHEIWPVRTQSFKSAIVGRFYNTFGEAPSNNAIQEALTLFCAKAQFDGPERIVGIRVLRSARALYIDLADEQWRAIRIQDSKWEMTSAPVVMFNRGKGARPLPVPIPGGSLNELRDDFLHVSEEQWRLIVAWLIGAFHPDGPYPILVLQGEHGSGKSTVARMLRMLVDPAAPLTRTIPREERDLMIAARNNWVIAINNLSGLDQWLSDALCRLSTGGGFSTRQLYTDDEEIIFEAKRPILLNGIDEIAKSPDLADRALIVTLPALPEKERITEKVFWENFAEAHPRILGSLLNAVTAAQANIDNTNVERPPRMADFTNWIAAAGRSLPFTTEEFLGAYRANRQESVQLSLESSAVGTTIQTLVNSGPFEGTYTELLEKLSVATSEEIRKSKIWPKNARALSSVLRRLAPLLRADGIQIRELTLKDGRKRFAIKRE